MKSSLRSTENEDVFEHDMFDDEQPEDLKEPVPLLENGWGSYGDYRLVGNGEVTNPETCGKRATLKGCLNVHLHDKITLDGVNYAGKVFVRRVQMSCGKPSCPKCFKSGWAVREAGKIEARLVEASKRFGKVEHIIVSVPVTDYGLDYNALRRKVNRMLKKIGVIGNALIFHGFRYRPHKGWYFSPHFHALGFILGGYSRCRHCKGDDCYSCDGFDGKTYKLYRESGYIVRVMGERKTVFGTAWYQLNHSSYKVGVKRFHIATWSGVCSYRKLKVTVEMRKDVCPICQHELIKIRYFGSKRLQLSEERDSFEDYEEDGVVVFVERVSRRKGIAVARNLITEDDYFRLPSRSELEKWEEYESSFPKSALIDKVFPKRSWGSKWSLGSRGGVDGS